MSVQVQPIISYGTVLGLDTLVTVANVTLWTYTYHIEVPPWTSTPTTTTPIAGQGFDVGLDKYSHANFGAIADNTFLDTTFATRTVTAAYQESASYFWLTLSGSSIPDTNATFTSITMGSTTLNRSARANYYSNTPSGGTTWVWGSASNPWGGTGSGKIFKVNV